MKEIRSKVRPVEHPRLSLEQKIVLMVHRYRVAEKRRKKKDDARLKRFRMIALIALTVILLPSLAILVSHSSASGAQTAFDQAVHALASVTTQAARDDPAITAPIYSTLRLLNLGNAFLAATNEACHPQLFEVHISRLARARVSHI